MCWVGALFLWLFVVFQVVTVWWLCILWFGGWDFALCVASCCVIMGLFDCALFALVVFIVSGKFR